MAANTVLEQLLDSEDFSSDCFTDDFEDSTVNDTPSPSSCNVSTDGDRSRSMTPSTTSTSNCSSSVFTTTLARLRRPTSAEISRKRKTSHNRPPKGKKRSKGSGRNNPKSVTPQHRVTKYPNQCLTVSNGKLFCLACREEISLKTSIISNHVKSVKHNSGKKALQSKQKKDMELVQTLRSYDASENPCGKMLPDQQRIYRLKVVKTFLTAGVPLNKIPAFRELLEENGYRLTDRRHLSDLIPFILAQEKEKLKASISGHQISIIFDGTSRLGEVFIIVVRYIDCAIQQKVIRLRALVTSMTGEEIARELVSVKLASILTKNAYIVCGVFC